MMEASAALAVWLGLTVGAAQPAATGSWPDAEELQGAGYFKYWEAPLPLRRGDRVRAIHLLDDNIYVTTGRGEVLAVHRGVGLLRWVRRVTDPGLAVFAPSHIDNGEGTGPVVFATASNISIIDRYSGELLKEIPPSFAFGGPAAADESRVFVGSSDGHFYALRWHDPLQHRITRLWRVMAGGPVRTAPVLVDADHLYFASQGGGVFCCTSEARILNWEFPTHGAITGNMHVDPSGVYVAGTDRSVYRLDPISGSLRWRRRLPEILRHGPVVTHGVVYQYCPGYGIYAIDTEYGDVLWNFPDGRQFAARDGDRVCLVTASGRLVLVNNNTGTALGGFSLPRKLQTAVNRDDGAVYLVSPAGALTCLKPEGEPRLSARAMEAAHFTLNERPRPTPGEGTTGDSTAPANRKP